METVEISQAKADTLQKIALLNQLTEQSIWAMGVSFILGSLFTILLLMTLDYIRGKSQQRTDEEL